MPVRVFISYSHKDEEWKDRLAKHVNVLARGGRVALWQDRLIEAGSDWRAQIERALDDCDVALLLISADFLVSEFILAAEVPRLLERREKEGVRVIPVIARPCAWQRVEWLARLQAWPRDGKPLSALSDDGAEQALADLTAALAGPAPRPQARVPLANARLGAGAKANAAAGAEALRVWEEKLDFLLVEEARAADALQRFSLRKAIEEAQAKIRELRGRA